MNIGQIKKADIIEIRDLETKQLLARRGSEEFDNFFSEGELDFNFEVEKSEAGLILFVSESAG